MTSTQGCRRHDPARPERCHLCWLVANRPEYRPALTGPVVPVLPLRQPGCLPLPVCPHRGEVIEAAPCGSEAKHVRDCALHDRCTYAANNGAVHCCLTCDDNPHRVKAPASDVVRIDADRLHKDGKGHPGFNASVFRYQGRLLLAYRTGWAGSQLHIATLGPDLQPVDKGVTIRNLNHSAAGWGREDPRLFTYRGRLHLSYIGVVGAQGPTNQLYARLRDDLTVDELFIPTHPFRMPWEKNWAFFEWEGELMAVYTVGPRHSVVHVRGNRAWPFADEANSLPWAGGLMRGGAPPVLVKGRFQHWFHGRTSDGNYNIGITEFEAKPPFRVVRQTVEPILSATESEGNYCAVYFPCGAILEAGSWLVSMGVNDRRIELRTWPYDSVDKMLEGQK